MLMMLPRNLTAGQTETRGLARLNWGQYLAMLLPLLVCEVMWSLGENVYAAIYGHMSTDASAAMTLTNPVQGLVIGALCGLSQAAGVIIGKRLGSGDEEGALWASKRLLLYGAAGAGILSVTVMLLSGAYVNIYQVDAAVKTMTRRRHSAQRRPDEIRHVHRPHRHMVLRRSPGAAGGVRSPPARRRGIFPAVAGGMHPLWNFHGRVPQKEVDAPAGSFQIMEKACAAWHTLF